MKTFLYRGVPVIGIAAPSGSGKTTLLKRLIPALTERGKRIAIVKHAHHDFDIDFPGKDSYELRKAGAPQVLVGSGHRWALVVETNTGADPLLSDMLNELSLRDTNLIVVEGFRHVVFPKIEVHRAATGRKTLFSEDSSVIAVVSNDLGPDDVDLPLFRLEDVAGVAAYIDDYCHLARG